jgi:hypothetical protein
MARLGTDTNQDQKAKVADRSTRMRDNRNFNPEAHERLPRMSMLWRPAGDRIAPVSSHIHQWNANRLRLTEAPVGGGGRLLVLVSGG